MEGEKAPHDTPITFRQLVLHMDEEVACTEGNGIDFQKIELFDEWCRKNFDKLLPEKKGVVVARPRRTEVKYCDNPLVNNIINIIFKHI